MNLPRTSIATLDLWPITVDEVIQDRRSQQLYELYLESMGPMRTRAAARHLISAAEFEEEMLDPRIKKYTAWRTPTEPAALATITTHLEAMPWISPAFFTARYPAHAARQAIYYLGLALVAPGKGQYRLLERVVREMVIPCADDRGVLAFDVCSYNDTMVRFGRRAEAALRRIAPVRLGVADVQTYYEAVFE